MAKAKTDLTQVTLPVIEAFRSLQGEATFTGCLCTFIRFYGCNLRCSWCDTKYSYDPAETPVAMSLADILLKVEELGCEVVELTGGEPLIHGKPVLQLMEELVARRYDVLLETNGAVPLDRIPDDVHIIMDVKCPSSGHHEKLVKENFGDLNYNDDVKFIIANRADFDYACSIIKEHKIPENGQNCIFSPASPLLSPQDLSAWVLETFKVVDGKPVSSRIKMQVQLHKLLWGNERNR